ncbi:MAG: hypothetical protein ACYCOO_08940 [Chitinophagaceae bacterium]
MKLIVGELSSLNICFYSVQQYFLYCYKNNSSSGYNQFNSKSIQFCMRRQAVREYLLNTSCLIAGIKQ